MPPSGLTIALAAHAGDNTINAGEPAAGFAITGATGDLADGQIATVSIVNSLDAPPSSGLSIGNTLGV